MSERKPFIIGIARSSDRNPVTGKFDRFSLLATPDEDEVILTSRRDTQKGKARYLIDIRAQQILDLREGHAIAHMEPKKPNSSAEGAYACYTTRQFAETLKTLGL